MSKYGVFIGLGLELTALVFIGLWVGNWLEKKHPTGGLILVACLMLSFAGWLARIVISLRKLAKDNEKKAQKDLADKDLKM